MESYIPLEVGEEMLIVRVGCRGDCWTILASEQGWHLKLLECEGEVA